MAPAAVQERGNDDGVGGKEAKGPVVQCLDDFVNSDLTAERNEYCFRTPFLVDRMSVMLKDHRDLPMLCLLLNVVEFIVPGVALVYGLNVWMPDLPLVVRHAIGACYYVSLLVLFAERFTLCLHYGSHRSIFYNGVLNMMMTVVLSPFFGIPPGVYHLHHVIMHHIENNHENDASSTEQYQRDSLLAFGRYWLRFMPVVWYDLVYFCACTKRWTELVETIASLVVWITLIVLSAKYVNFVATLWVFVIPHFVEMTFLAFGNWSQHIFVDVANRHSNYALTYNCLDSASNQTSFNDGYHIVHHQNARLHWSEMPKYFHDTREKHFQNGALTFRGLPFTDVGLLVMTGQLRKLAEKYYVHIGSRDTAPTADEVEAKLRDWLRPVPKTPVEAKTKAA